MFSSRFTVFSGLIAFALGYSLPAAAAIMVADITVSPLPISGLVEGSNFTNGAVSTINDLNPTSIADYTASIYWGDGATSAGTITSMSAGIFTVTGSHTYTEEGSYSYRTDVFYSPLGAVAQGVIGQTNVADAPLSLISTASPISFTPGVSLSNLVLATFGDANPFGPVTDFTGLIDWGDGTQSAGTIIAGSPGEFSLEGSHTYASGGSFPVLIGINDVGGASLRTRTTAATVPEPSSLALLGLGLAGLASLRRRKQ